jgi:hypothetical protein
VRAAKGRKERVRITLPLAWIVFFDLWCCCDGWQIIFWVGFFELVTMPALFETLNGEARCTHGLALGLPCPGEKLLSMLLQEWL